MMTGMLPIELIICLVFMFTESIKRMVKGFLVVAELDPGFAPVSALILGVLLNVLNAYLFLPEVTVEVVRQAAREGALASAAAAGIWSASKSYFAQSSHAGIGSRS